MGIISKCTSRDCRQPQESHAVLLYAAQSGVAFPVSELPEKEIRTALVQLTLLLGIYSSCNTACVCVSAHLIRFDRNVQEIVVEKISKITKNYSSK